MVNDASAPSLFKAQYKPFILLLDVGLLLLLLNALPFAATINHGLSLFIFIAILWLT